MVAPCNLVLRRLIKKVQPPMRALRRGASVRFPGDFLPAFSQPIQAAVADEVITRLFRAFHSQSPAPQEIAGLRLHGFLPGIPSGQGSEKTPENRADQHVVFESSF